MSAYHLIKGDTQHLGVSPDHHSSAFPMDYALAYARRGWLVFPLHTVQAGVCSCGHEACESQGKHPRTKNGVKDATTDVEQIRRWWTMWPEANIGVATGTVSGLYVIDIDCHKGGDLDSLKDYGLADLMCSLIAETGSKGYHIYLRCTEPLPNTANKLGPFIDTRGEGGYVVAPPGFNAQGQYAWLHKAPLEPIPAALLAKLRPRTSVSASLPPLPTTPQPISATEILTLNALPATPLPGQIPATPALRPVQTQDTPSVSQEARNSYLISLAGSLRGRGLTPAEIRAMLLAANEERYGHNRHPKGPLSRDEMERTIFKSLEKWQPGPTNALQNLPFKPLTDLMERDIPPVTFLVPDLLPEGLTLVAGKPKTGKSWLLLGLIIDIAHGSPALGKLAVTPAGVLYVSPEDGEARFKERSAKALAGRPTPTNFHYGLTCEPLLNGGLQQLEAFLEIDPTIKVIVIDTLGRLRSPGMSRNMYQDDYALMGALHEFAHTHRIALVVVHHTRKEVSADPFDEVSGTNAMAGAADTTMILKRGRFEDTATLFITGRDVDEQELALTFHRETASWTLTGHEQERRVSQARQEILDLLREREEGMTPSEIAQELEKSKGTVRVLLLAMLRQEDVQKRSDGRYTLPAPPSLFEAD